MTQPVIFISYSPQDENEKDELLAHLGVLHHQGLIDLWSDHRIGPGADWEQEMVKALAQAKVAILLISANFLTSASILDKEVPILLKRRQNEGLTIFPVIAKACAWQEVDWLTRLSVRPKGGRPIWGKGRADINGKLAAIAQEVIAVINSSSTPVIRGTYANLEETIVSPQESPANQSLVETKAGNILIGTISNSSGFAIGSGSTVTVNQSQASSAETEIDPFQIIYRHIERRPLDEDVDKGELTQTIEKIQTELAKGPQANPKKIERWLLNLEDIAPDIFKLAADYISISPLATVPAIHKLVERAKVE